MEPQEHKGSSVLTLDSNLRALPHLPSEILQGRLLQTEKDSGGEGEEFHRSSYRRTNKLNCMRSNTNWKTSEHKQPFSPLSFSLFLSLLPLLPPFPIQLKDESTHPGASLGFTKGEAVADQSVDSGAELTFQRTQCSYLRWPRKSTDANSKF